MNMKLGDAPKSRVLTKEVMTGDKTIEEMIKRLERELDNGFKSKKKGRSLSNVSDGDNSNDNGGGGTRTKGARSSEA